MGKATDFGLNLTHCCVGLAALFSALAMSCATYYPTAYAPEETDGIYATGGDEGYRSEKGQWKARYERADNHSSPIPQTYYGTDIDLKNYDDSHRAEMESHPNLSANGDYHINIYDEGLGLYAYPYLYGGWSAWDWTYPWYGSWDCFYLRYYSGYYHRIWPGWGVGWSLAVPYTAGDWIWRPVASIRRYSKNPRYDSRVYRRVPPTHRYFKNPRYDSRVYRQTAPVRSRSKNLRPDSGTHRRAPPTRTYSKAIRYDSRIHRHRK